MVKYSVTKLSPEEYKKMDKFHVTYGTVDTKFGNFFMGWNKDTICFSAFVDGKNSALPKLKETFPNAIFTEDNQVIRSKAKPIFENTSDDEIKILVKGTEFQTKVWEELVNLPRGSTCSYEDIAKAIGNPKAVRAVANAVAKNNVPYMVPCHRVISKTGGIGKYGYGVEKKLKILKDENAV